MSIQKLILIGSSTGGPGHIEKILKSLPETLHSKIIIAQHMDKNLLGSFSHRLDSITKASVGISDESTTIEDGPDILICLQSCQLVKEGYGHRLAYVNSTNTNYNPDIDIFFHSVAQYTPHFNILAILLTGIGNDGAKGLFELKERGARTVAESAESAVVYGMPRSAHEMGAARKVLSLEEIIEEIMRFDTETL